MSVIRRNLVPYATIPRKLVRDGSISANARLLYAILATYAIDKDTAHPGHELLCTHLDRSERSLARDLSELRKAGWVHVEKRSTGTNRYTLLEDTGVTTQQPSEVYPPATDGGRDQTPVAGAPLSRRIEVEERRRADPFFVLNQVEEGNDIPSWVSNIAETWIQYRIEQKFKPLGKTALTAFVKRVLLMGEPRALAAIDHTIPNGWQGLREEEKKPEPAWKENQAQMHNTAAYRTVNGREESMGSKFRREQGLPPEPGDAPREGGE